MIVGVFAHTKQLKAMTPCNNCSNIRYRSACKDCRLVKGKLQECELGYERTIAEIEQRHQEALKQALSQRSKALPPITKIVSVGIQQERSFLTYGYRPSNHRQRSRLCGNVYMICRIR